MVREPEALNAARFFDEASRDVGWARYVTRRAPLGSTLATFDVAGAEPDLALRLGSLDHRRLRIKYSDLASTTYQFRWASGYGNGLDLRIQGVLEPR
jgi:hypothetical protein